jgi:hypothetical protein
MVTRRPASRNLYFFPKEMLWLRPYSREICLQLQSRQVTNSRRVQFAQRNLTPQDRLAVAEQKKELENSRRTISKRLMSKSEVEKECRLVHTEGRECIQREAETKIFKRSPHARTSKETRETLRRIRQEVQHPSPECWWALQLT